MPKELINGKRLSEHDDSPLVEVAWGRGAGVVTLAAMSVDENGDPDAAATYVHLPRAGINRLIRTLRRARDQAYGADA